MIERIKVGPIQTNCYIVYDEQSHEAMVVDPGYNDVKVINFIENNNLKVKYIYITHCHFDHVSGVMGLKEKTNALIVSYFDEQNNLLDSDVNLSKMMTGNEITIKCDKTVFGNDDIEIGRYSFRVIHTPGHTSGSTCLYTDGMLISGDTIFKDTYGRCDLPTSNERDIIKSITNKLINLPADTIVYPGHGEITTIKEFSEVEL